jgi:hypothetical protein
MAKDKKNEAKDVNGAAVQADQVKGDVTQKKINGGIVNYGGTNTITGCVVGDGATIINR